MFDNPALLGDLMHSNINGFVLKDKGKDELIFAIEQVAKGQIYFSQEIMQHLLSFKKNNDAPRLTLREIEIIKLETKFFTNGREVFFLLARTQLKPIVVIF